MTNTALGRTELAILTNKSGGSVAQGDVVIVDTANASAFTTTTSSAYVSGRIGVVYEPNGISNNSQGLVAFSGYVSVINLSGTGSIGDMVKTHTVAKQGARHAAPQAAGDFAQVLGTSATPAALLFGTVQLGGGSGVSRSGSTTDDHLATWDGNNADAIQDGGVVPRVLISEQTPTGTGTVTFSSIPGTYKHLELEFLGRSTASGTSIGATIKINNDGTAANYRRTQHYGYGASTDAADGADNNDFSNFPGSTSPSGSAQYGWLQIPFYALTTFNKVMHGKNTARRDTSSFQLIVIEYAVEWESASAVTQIDIILASGNYDTGSTFRLYGVL